VFGAKCVELVVELWGTLIRYAERSKLNLVPLERRLHDTKNRFGKWIGVCGDNLAVLLWLPLVL